MASLAIVVFLCSVTCGTCNSVERTSCGETRVCDETKDDTAILLQSHLQKGSKGYALEDTYMYNSSKLKKHVDCNPTSVISAPIVTPNDSSYDVTRAQWASAMATTQLSDSRLKPKMIILCKSDLHVVEAVSFAKQCGYKVSVRSGGHQYAGLSSCPADSHCLQLDVSALDTFHNKNGTNQITLGVGLTLKQVLDLLLPLGLVIPTGICNSVGVGGHFQSSSQGFLTRSFGLGMDHVISFRIVTANGVIEVVDANSNPELYWAVLGGCPGSWGVVLDYTFEAISVVQAPHTQVIMYFWPYSHDLFTKITSEYMKISMKPELARDLLMLLVVQPITGMPAARGDYTHYIILQTLWTGIDSGALNDDLFAPMLSIMHPLPAPFPYLKTPMPLHYAVKTLTTDFDHRPFRYHVHSMSANTFFNNSFIKEMATELDERMKVDYMYSSFQLMSFGAPGKGSQVNRNKGKNAFPVRDIMMHVDDWVFFLHDNVSAIAEKRIEDFRASSSVHWQADGSAESSWMTTGTMVDHDDVDRFKKYFPSYDWFHRLQKVKTKIDPTDLFSSSMTIPPLKNSRCGPVPLGKGDHCIAGKAYATGPSFAKMRCKTRFRLKGAGYTSEFHVPWEADCAKYCDNTPGCVGFDIRERRNGNKQCSLCKDRPKKCLEIHGLKAVSTRGRKKTSAMHYYKSRDCGY